ncbi:MAG TPA: CoA transferase [Streptosporangiaceae bacterium]|jgi:crotonobetainyl-CoA:carnitine CoA-transferase CaiB-like acyl-CoA transferase
MDESQLSGWLGRSGLTNFPATSLDVTGADPALPSRYRIGEAAAVGLALSAAAAADIHATRGGPAQEISASVRAAALAITSYQHNRLDDQPVPRQPPGVPTSSIYECGSGGWFHLQGALPHLRRGTLDLLGCGDDLGEVAAALRHWDAGGLEEALAERGLCGARARSWDEWSGHEQGAVVTAAPLVEIIRIGDAPPRDSALAGQPLAGVRVLDLTRILAGPVAGKMLASYGADVLHVSTPARPNIRNCVIDTGFGKRSCELDLGEPDQAGRLRELADGCDVFVNGYRSGGLEGRGLGPQDLAERNPGIVYVSVNCYGHEGPWQQRRGWEQMAQTVTGIVLDEGDERPRLLPGAPNDYITGFVTAYGAMAALQAQLTTGGSWWVQASLCQTAAWIQRAGHIARPDVGIPEPETGDLAVTDSGFGRLRHLRPAVRMSATPPSWDRPPPVLGSDRAEWQPS